MRDDLFPGVDLEVLDTMHGSSRSRVRRVSDGARTLVLKEHLQESEGWVRESAALSVLPPSAPAPRLIASRSAPPAVALSDAGSGGSVADALLGDDPARAADAVAAWARAVATLHRVSAGSREAFRDALAARAGDLVLIDFEAAEWRSVAWDVAYLTVPWPSCWCAWRLPSSVTSAAVEAYRNAVGLALAPDFGADIAAASAAWALISASWFLPKALPDDPPLVKQGPTRRAMIQHRLRMAGAAEASPAMAELARRLGRVLTARWGERPLEYAPAFRTGT